jgi:hypothetical protein
MAYFFPTDYARLIGEEGQRPPVEAATKKQQ